MNRAEHKNPTKKNREATAPYNFVPLPKQIITVNKDELPGHDRYMAGTHTGWFDCELETCSPTYVRGMMTPEQFEKYDPDEEKKLPIEEQIKLKEERAPFYSARPEEPVEGRAVPMIPGSSLRGLIRSLLEIVSYGKMRWINKTPKVTFRAVAAASDDPLSRPYKEAFKQQLRAGYLKKKGDGWEILPALKPSNVGLKAEKGAYIKVKEARIPNGAISNFVRFDSPNYWPEYFLVSFSASIKRGKRGPYVSVDQIGDDEASYPYQGALVCTGNMKETVRGTGRDQKSPRRNHHLLLLDDEDATPLPISPEVLQDYEDSLTDFQRDELWKRGGLEDGMPVGAPVFYLEGKGTVIWFGHTPNFRVPALNNKGRAATPLDFIPKELRKNEQPDLAEAIFGWVEEEVNYKLTERSLRQLADADLPEDVLQKLQSLQGQWYPKNGFLRLLKKAIGESLSENRKRLILKYAEKDDLEDQCAGRVFFGDAYFTKDRKDIWYSQRPLTPSTLGSPKITTFQHYLVQDKSQGHDPDLRQTLAHYGHTLSETEIRGHKLYWHKGDKPPIEATAKEKEKEKQLTRTLPIGPGVGFKFSVHFENLRDYELGALAWALQLPGDAGKTYRHKLGMGKPLGMGAVKIAASLYLTERSNKETGRYASLLAQDRLTDGATAADLQAFINAFEAFVLKRIAPDKKCLTELDRIRMLLAMLQWRELSPEWLEQSRYLKIEPNNEYKERPVLPDPLAVSGERAAG